jgi:hypothetical protein
MTLLLRTRVFSGLFLLALLVPFAAGQGPTFSPARTPPEAGVPPPVPGGEDMIPQPRGPVHESFALPPDMAPRPGPIVPKKPPAPISEMPPDQKPEGDNVQWIPGYWAWDAEREDFLWISGLWRVPPDGRKWVPGSWNAVARGYQWSPGFWAPANQEELPYLPQPPASLDNGPNIPQPNGDSFYVPGNWMYQSSNYLWQPGYWQAYRPGMIWTPSYYSWTPSGYLFVPGFWDWPLANRGLLFAPVAFNRPLWMTPGWFYQPSYAVAYPNLLSSLFTGPGGYYFGNYYGPAYRRLGFQPWFASTGVSNPLFAWYRWRNLNNPNWLNGLYTTYRGRFNGTLPRPPLTFQPNILNSLQTVQPIGQLNGVRLARLSAAQVNAQRNLALSLQRFSVERQVIREARRSLALARLPGSTVAPTIQGYAALAGRAGPINPVRAIAPGAIESRILTAHHTPATIAMPRTVQPVPHTPFVPRIPAPAHPLQSGALLNPRVIAPHNPIPALHATPLAPVHQALAIPHFTPPAHHFAPPAHHLASPSHGGGHHR